MGERSHRDREERGETSEESQLRLMDSPLDSIVQEEADRTDQCWHLPPSAPHCGEPEQLLQRKTAAPSTQQREEGDQTAADHSCLQPTALNKTLKHYTNLKVQTTPVSNGKCKFVCVLGVKILISDFLNFYL